MVVVKSEFEIVNLKIILSSTLDQFESMPVLEEAMTS